MRRAIAFLSILGAWPVVLVHRLWNYAPPRNVKWILFEDVEMDVQWYVCDVCNILSNILFVFGFWLMAKKLGYSLYVLISAFLIINILDLVHYLGWYKRNEYFVFIEGVVLIIAAIRIYKKSCKTQL